MSRARPLLQTFPQLDPSLFISLADLPTPLERIPQLERGAPRYIKREDHTSAIYGGNKIRTLEGLFAQALASGAERIWSMGAYGSNHAVAAAMHAPRVGMSSGALLFPQPATRTAQNNVRALIALGSALETMPHALALPIVALREQRRSPSDFMMLPGGASPHGALGHISAALELEEQLRGETTPKRIVLAVGSGCTTAGLLLGFALAERLAKKERRRFEAPIIHAVRVTPFPITSPANILRLAFATARFLEPSLGELIRFDLRQLARKLVIDRRYFGGGYGLPLRAQGAEARRRFESSALPFVDEVYSEKSAAAFLALSEAYPETPLLYWATRAPQALPIPTDEALNAAPEALRRFLEKRPIRR